MSDKNELPAFAVKVIGKLRRFDECASDFEAGGVDIGRHWLDVLTQLGLLDRVQRSPALWEITQQGEDVLESQVDAPAEDVRAVGDEPVAWHWIEKGDELNGFESRERVTLKRPSNTAASGGMSPLFYRHPQRPVVMPERHEDRCDSSEAETYQNGWNACLDEFARLNK